MRLFFAVQLETEVIAKIASFVDELRAELSAATVPPSAITWETPDKLHYTLKFLGDLDMDPLHMETLTHAIEVARVFAPFSLAPGVLGAFPDEAAPRVLFLGVDEGEAPLTILARELDALLGGFGYSRDVRPYRPHLTLARAKGEAGERALSKLLSTKRPRTHFGATRIDRFVLMQSIGGAYRVRLELALGAS